MFEFKAKRYIDAQDMLVHVVFGMISKDARFWPRLLPASVNKFKLAIHDLVLETAPQEFEMCRLAAHRLLNTLTSTTDSQIILNQAQDLRTRIIDQMESTFCLCLTRAERDLYQPGEPLFGPQVERKFPAVSEDIDNAAKCLALGQGTASVFHLMRALECVVQVLGDKLGATIFDKNNNDLDWGIIISNMKAPVEAMQKGTNKDKWSEALTLLVHVKQAWRHPTMHPKKTYTDKEARKVFDATSEFMQHLAILI